jgi:hypothetical protein
MNMESEHKGAATSIDTQELLKFLRGAPKAKRIVSLVLALRELADHTTFPINSYADLKEKIGRKHLVIGGLRLNTRMVESIIPKHYFPIASRENLIEKAIEFYQLSIEQRLSPTLPLPPPRAVASFRATPPQLKSTISAKER